MVLRANQNSDADEAVLIIQPNRNLTWNQSKWLFLFFAFSIGLVGIYFYSLGAWLVLRWVGDRHSRHRHLLPKLLCALTASHQH
ncbi:MAG: DUF2244 domain-containing protein [Candidatus Thiodiazotropha sp. (ex Lucinoma kastoroae)]|nr:DUF2244 domain-containing protein [Candidatus Thiodiazotropha sp. (ex Rostrolucina anterorostrata)]MCU7847669.1 DUF2244 domain-containing protein [Candidatus Thiodiazotropha sp. (ex Lucinoma kastoroae)]MCU7860206.1 DUF2244 domain-containing protein [Candidatus Thiodiazotropha sp. (ex Lucinoma kastoroae)]